MIPIQRGEAAEGAYLFDNNGSPGQSRTADLRFRKRLLSPKHNDLAYVGACSTPQFMAVVADTEHLSEHKTERLPGTTLVFPRAAGVRLTYSATDAHRLR